VKSLLRNIRSSFERQCSTKSIRIFYSFVNSQNFFIQYRCLL